MYSYTLTQWVLFFFCYCFLGWIWECFYVSTVQAIKNKKFRFINRGFLHGPLIPIYGFAAVSILLATIRLREHVAAVYVMGALTATIFELVTGTAMEQIFKVKYWDYSNVPLNYKGHIALPVSLFWGFFAVILVEVIHVPVESFLLRVPEFLCEMAAFALMAVTAYDTALSFNEAMDLRELMESLAESNETIQRLERRFDAVVAFTPVPDIEEMIQNHKSAKENVLDNVERMRKRNRGRLEQLKLRLQLPDFEELPDKKEILEQIEQQLHKSFARHNKQFLRAASQLRRNPTLTSMKHRETLESLREIIKRR